MGKKLNLGCGESKIDGYINIDNREVCNPDLLLNIGEEQFPFDDNSVSEVLCHHAFEHFPNFVAVVNELGRVSKNGAIWKITVPYATSYLYNVANPYHVNLFTEDTFRFWQDIYIRERPKHFKLQILETQFDYHTEIWGSTNDWERLRKTNINVVRSIYQKIEVVK